MAIFRVFYNLLRSGIFPWKPLQIVRVVFFVATFGSGNGRKMWIILDYIVLTLA